MRYFRSPYFIGSFYELLRFVFLFLITAGIVTPGLNQVYLLLILMLAAPALAVFPGFVFLGLYPRQYTVLRKYLALVKAVSILPVVIGFLNTIGLVRFASAPKQLQDLGLVFGIIILFDLILFVFLVSYRERKEVGKQDETVELPDFNEVEIKE